MNWFFFALNSIFFFTFLSLLQRKLAVKTINARAMAVAFNGIAAVLALIIFFVAGDFKTFSLPTQPVAWFALAVAVLAYGLFERGRFLAAKLLDASVFSTISNISLLVAFIGSVFLYSESLSVNKLIGAGLIISALVLISIEKNMKTVSAKGVLVGVLVSISLGVAWMMDKTGVTYFTPSSYSILVWLLPILVISFPSISISAIKLEWHTASWKILVLAALNVIGYLTQLMAFEVGEATKVIPVIQTSTLATVILGIVILKERDNIVRKVIAGVLAVVGVYFLV